MILLGILKIFWEFHFEFWAFSFLLLVLFFIWHFKPISNKPESFFPSFQWEFQHFWGKICPPRSLFSPQTSPEPVLEPPQPQKGPKTFPERSWGGNRAKNGENSRDFVGFGVDQAELGTLLGLNTKFLGFSSLKSQFFFVFSQRCFYGISPDLWICGKSLRISEFQGFDRSFFHFFFSPNRLWGKRRGRFTGSCCRWWLEKDSPAANPPRCSPSTCESETSQKIPPKSLPQIPKNHKNPCPK